MNYKELLFDTLEKLGTSKTNLGYDYIEIGRASCRERV